MTRRQPDTEELIVQASQGDGRPGRRLPSGLIPVEVEFRSPRRESGR
jgi:hypothetical protein